LFVTKKSGFGDIVKSLLATVENQASRDG